MSLHHYWTWQLYSSVLSPLGVCTDDSTLQLSPCFHLNRQEVHLHRFHLALIKPDLCSDPCLKAMLVNLPPRLCVSAVIIYYADIRETVKIRLLGLCPTLLLGHAAIGLCRHIFSWSLSNAQACQPAHLLGYVLSSFLATDPSSVFMLTCLSQLLHWAGRHGFNDDSEQSQIVGPRSWLSMEALKFNED